MTKKFERGDQIAYIPQHIEKKMEKEHKELFDFTFKEGMEYGIEYGFVTSGPNRHGDYFCRYWSKYELDENDQPTNLRTRANSECTPVEQMWLCQSVRPSLLEWALEEHC